MSIFLRVEQSNVANALAELKSARRVIESSSTLKLSEP